MSGEPLILTFDAEQIRRVVAEEVARQLAEWQHSPGSEPAGPYMTAEEAAELLRCRKRRVYELVGDGRLTRHGEGRRLLLRSEEVKRLAAGALTRR